MLRDVFKSIGGFESYGVISMIFFVIFFLILLWHTLSIKKKDVDRFSRFPLDDFTKESDDTKDI